MPVSLGVDDGRGWTVPCRSYLLLVGSICRTHNFSSIRSSLLVCSVDMSCIHPSTTHQHVHVPWCPTVPPPKGMDVVEGPTRPMDAGLVPFPSLQTWYPCMEKGPRESTMVIDVLDPFQPPTRDPISIPSTSKGGHPTQTMGKNKKKTQTQQVPTIDPERDEPRKHHIKPTGTYPQVLTWPVALAIKKARPYAYVGRLALRADPTAM